MTRDVFHIFVTHAGLVYDVSDKTTEHKMITLTVVFCRLSYNDFLTNRVRRRKKSNETTAVYILDSVPIEMSALSPSLYYLLRAHVQHAL